MQPQLFTIGLISDCPTLTFHPGKCFKVLIDSSVAISLMCRSVYTMLEDHYKSIILPVAVNFQTADGLSMSSMGKETLYLWIVDFNFSHTFMICDTLLETDFLFAIDLQK